MGAAFKLLVVRLARAVDALGLLMVVAFSCLLIKSFREKRGELAKPIIVIGHVRVTVNRLR